MPRYDYECRDCGHVFEARQSFHDDPLTECPECGGEIRRVIAPVGIVFKGGGYYVTDTRGTEKSAAPAAETEPSPSDAGGDVKGAAESATSDSATGSATSDAKASESGAGTKAGKADEKAPTSGSGTAASSDGKGKA